jgi:hypothetical protein
MIGDAKIDPGIERVQQSSLPLSPEPHNKQGKGGGVHILLAHHVPATMGWI